MDPKKSLSKIPSAKSSFGNYEKNSLMQSGRRFSWAEGQKGHKINPPNFLYFAEFLKPIDFFFFNAGNSVEFLTILGSEKPHISGWIYLFQLQCAEAPRLSFPFFSLFFSVGITVTVSRTPLGPMPGELFSPGLFTAVIKCLWIAQPPIFESLSLYLLKAREKIYRSAETKLFFFRERETERGELLALKCSPVDSR